MTANINARQSTRPSGQFNSCSQGQYHTSSCQGSLLSSETPQVTSAPTPEHEPPHSCSISMTDNTTSSGWLRKSNFAETGEKAPHLLAKLQVARSHANRFIDHDIKEYSQWFPCKANLIADALSRDFHLSNTQLTALVRSSLQPQNR